jgi:outer membrane protein assembly factor BamB
MVVAATFAFAAAAADWPQYAGPNLDRTTQERLAKAWPSGGPKAAWRSQSAGGFSSYAVADGKAFTIVSRDIEAVKREVLVAQDAGSGKEIWAQPIDVAKYDGGGDSGTPDNKGGDGPRSTPAVDGGKVYVISARLIVACYDAADGKAVWKRDLMKDHAGRNVQWQNAASPLIDGDLLFVAGGGAGQSFLALNKASGEVVWKKHDDRITHATPVAATIHGQRQVIFFMQSGLVSLNPADGAILWKHPFKYQTSTAASPVVGEDVVYCAAGYGVGAMAVRISNAGGKFTARELWRSAGNQPVANHWSTPVYHKGHLYGMFSFKEYGKGPVKCVEIATGKVKWEKSGFGAGNVILTGDSVLALSDNGTLVQFQADPASYKELSRAKVISGKCWSTPTVANGRIFVRSTKEGACLNAAPAVAAK